MPDNQQSDIAVGGVLLAALGEFRRIWVRALLLTILIFVVDIFLSILIASIDPGFAENGWSTGGFLYSWMAILMAYAVIIRLSGYLLDACQIDTVSPQPKSTLVRSVFVETTAFAALMAVPATLDPEDGLSLWDVVISVPWSLADTVMIAFLIYTAIRRDFAWRHLDGDFSWREMPTRVTGMLIVVTAFLGAAVGILLEYIRGFRYADPGNLDTVMFDAGTELTILGSHFIASWLLGGLFAAIFISWYKLLPSVQVRAGGIRNIFS